MLRIDARFLALRLVDNKAVLYFDAPTPSEALNWYRGKQVSSPPPGEVLTRVAQRLICIYQHRKPNLTNFSCVRVFGFSSPIRAVGCMRSLLAPIAVFVYIHILFDIFVHSFLTLSSSVGFPLFVFFSFPLFTTQATSVNHTRLFNTVRCVQRAESNIMVSDELS